MRWKYLQRFASPVQSFAKALLCVSCLVAASCGGKSEESASPVISKVKPKVVHAARRASPAQQTAGMVLASSPTDSRPIADLKFELRERPAAGSPVTIEFALLPLEEAAHARLQFSASDGARIEGDTTSDFSDISPEQVLRTSIRVRADAGGIFYVSALATFSNSSDFTESRAFTLPLIVESIASAAK